MDREQGNPMHVVAGSFKEPGDAIAAMRELREVLDVTASDVDVAALAGTDGEAAVLAARVRERRLDDACRVVRQHGGRIVTDVPESWTEHTSTGQDGQRAGG